MNVKNNMIKREAENQDIRFKNSGELIEDKIIFDDFYKGTNADFKEIMKGGIPKRKPDFRHINNTN